VAMVSYAQTGMVVHDLGQTQRAHAKVVPVTDVRGGLEVPLLDVASLIHARRTIQRVRVPRGASHGLAGCIALTGRTALKDNGDREAMAMATQALDLLVHSPQLPRAGAALASAVGHVLDWVDDAFPDDRAASAYPGARAPLGPCVCALLARLTHACPVNLVAFWTGCHQTQPSGAAAAHDAGQFDLLVCVCRHRFCAMAVRAAEPRGAGGGRLSGRYGRA
jgi:hypothetical protein